MEDFLDLMNRLGVEVTVDIDTDRIDVTAFGDPSRTFIAGKRTFRCILPKIGEVVITDTAEEMMAIVVKKVLAL